MFHHTSTGPLGTGTLCRCADAGSCMKLAEAKEAKEKTDAQKAIVAADQQGDRKTLKADSIIPVGMAVIYLLLMLYFRGIGGYKAVRISASAESKH